MDVSQLSSNWKKIQANFQKHPETLKTAVGEGKNKPCKSSHAFRSVTTNLSKRRKVNSAPGMTSFPAKEVQTLKRGATGTLGRQQGRQQMGVLSSRPARIGRSKDEEDEITGFGSDVSVLPSNAIEDIPASQRILARRESSSTPRKQSRDVINSGLVAGVKAGRYIALDCEMVGVGLEANERSMLARVSVVNFLEEQVYDSFVAPKETITDYRTAVSGITFQLLQNARSFESVQRDIAELLRGRILVGHAVQNDLEALMLGHPKRDIRDTSRHTTYRELAAGRTPALKRLAKELLGVDIQRGAHSSIEDARITMLLYKREKDAFENEHMKRYGINKRHTVSQHVDGAAKAVSPDSADWHSGGRNKKKKKKRKR